MPLVLNVPGYATMNVISVPVSPGELIDKITILEIKSERITSSAKLANIRDELQLLESTWAKVAADAADVSSPRARLKQVNESLWEIEDAIRVEEKSARFGERFIELARSVYVRNDERAAIKREINEMLGSRLVEEKSYEDYR